MENSFICIRERTCTSLSIRDLTKDQLIEESLIDLAHAILEERKSSMLFSDLMKEIQNLLELSNEEVQERLVQFYTDINIDGRFLFNNDNTWGLREWYKIETIEEETAPTIKTRKRKKAVLSDDEEEIEIDEDDLVFEEDLEEFIDDEELEDEEDLDDDSIDDFVEDIEDIEVDDELDAVDDELLDEDDAFLIDDDEEIAEDEEKEE